MCQTYWWYYYPSCSFPQQIVNKMGTEETPTELHTQVFFGLMSNSTFWDLSERKKWNHLKVSLSTPTGNAVDSTKPWGQRWLTDLNINIKTWLLSSPRCGTTVALDPSILSVAQSPIVWEIKTEYVTCCSHIQIDCFWLDGTGAGGLTGSRNIQIKESEFGNTELSIHLYLKVYLSESMAVWAWFCLVSKQYFSIREGWCLTEPVPYSQHFGCKAT